MSAPRPSKRLCGVREYRVRGMRRAELRAEARRLGVVRPGSSSDQLRQAIVRELRWREEVEAS